MSPWPRDDRLQMMRSFIRIMDEDGLLEKIKPGYVAATYGIPVAAVHAEMMKHLHEGGEGK